MNVSTSTTVVAIRSGEQAVDSQGNLALLDPSTHRYLKLDAIGKRVWELLQVPRSTNTLTKVLAVEFHVSEHDAEILLFPLLNQMEQEHLIETL